MKVVNRRTKCGSLVAQQPRMLRPRFSKRTNITASIPELNRQIRKQRWKITFEEINEALMSATERCNSIPYKQLGADLLVFTKNGIQMITRFCTFKDEHSTKCEVARQAIYRKARERKTLRYQVTLTFRRSQTVESFRQPLHEKASTPTRYIPFPSPTCC